MRVQKLSAVVFFVAAGLAAQGPTQSPTQKQDGMVRTGTFPLRTKESHPAAKLGKIAKRMGWTRKTMLRHDPKLGYKVAAESFFVHVPKNYVDDGSFGVFVWISPGPSGNAGQDWPQALARARCIHIGPNNAGNKRFSWYRLALALDAVHAIRSRYRVDSERIYIAGHSGGGRLAATASLHWPDVFHGGLYSGGVNHFERVRKPGREKLYWPAKIPKPKGRFLRWARDRSRHVFLNGETDFNRVHSGLVYKAWKRRHRFKNLTLLAMPKKGHSHPDGPWLSRCIGELDASLLTKRKKQAQRDSSKR